MSTTYGEDHVHDVILGNIIFGGSNDVKKPEVTVVKNTDTAHTPPVHRRVYKARDVTTRVADVTEEKAEPVPENGVITSTADVTVTDVSEAKEQVRVQVVKRAATTGAHVSPKQVKLLDRESSNFERMFLL